MILIVLILTITVISSCFLSKKQEEIDSFYTRKNYADYQIVPLSKPVFVYFNKAYKEWFFKIPDSFKNKFNIERLVKIGVSNSYIYGEIPSQKRNVSTYKKGDIIYMYLNGSVTWTKDKKIVTDNLLQINSFDTILKNFMEPERWFIINVADSTTRSIFLENQIPKIFKRKKGFW